MSNELTLGLSLRFEKGESSELFTKSGIQLDVAGDDFVRQTQTVGTSEEALSIGDLSTIGYVAIVNRDSTNFVSVRPGTGENDLIKIPAGGLAMFQVASAAPYIIADTSSVQIELIAIEA